MAQSKTHEDDVQVDMTPMIDVTFQLLIFFIITLKFKLLEKKLNSNLPTEFGTQITDNEVDEMFATIKLRQSKRESGPLMGRTTELRFEDEEILAGDRAEVFARLGRKLTTFLRAQVDSKGRIDVGPGVPHREVVAVLDLFNRVGFKTVTFVGLPHCRQVDQGQQWWQHMQSTLAAK